MDLIAPLATIIGCIIAVAGFIVGILQYRSTAQISTFRLYADKHNSIITSDVIDDWHVALKEEDTSELWVKLTPQMISYLNLVWEEAHLAESGIISKRLWKIWQPDIVKVVNTKFAQDIINNYDYHFPSNLADELSKKS